ncbi:hypothetical protein [Pedosphaera parvula]|uniref:hypothetical protein n=1 Tax=Pedosphaera parvula TaxID=1032527 RepID=UPI000310F3C9|nr:hypothetical protein [Pedosphaera parvula]
MAQTELAFPVGDPVVKFDGSVVRASKDVDVIGHDEVTADEPSGGILPDLQEKGMDEVVGKQFGTVFGAKV